MQPTREDRHLRRAYACLVVLVGLVLGAPTDGKTQAARVPRIGYLVTHTEWAAYFQSALKNQGTSKERTCLWKDACRI
jgi:hypothetical protein